MNKETTLPSAVLWILKSNLTNTFHIQLMIIQVPGIKCKGPAQVDFIFSFFLALPTLNNKR